MRHLIICISMFFVVASCKNKAEDKVATQFKGYVNFVDSIERFNEGYMNGVDSTFMERPISPASIELTIDTLITQHKSLFGNSSMLGSEIVSNYMASSAIIDSMEKANCFTQDQRSKIQTAKKKFDKMVAEGALVN